MRTGIRVRAFSLLAALATTVSARGDIVAYDFEGLSNVGSVAVPFTGYFELDTGLQSTTVYFGGSSAVQEGFQSTYVGATVTLHIWLASGEEVSAGPGYIHINNIQQAEPGAQVPKGLTLQAYTSGTSGTINGISISNMYLAFLPVTPDFSWDGLDALLGGNAEAMLQANPLLLPPNVDPALTGTAMPADLLAVFDAGLFLGTSYGNTTSVNTIWSISPHVASCYADCDSSGSLAIDDFVCFQTLFAVGELAADCDENGSLSIDDFICFQTLFAMGC